MVVLRRDCSYTVELCLATLAIILSMPLVLLHTSHGILPNCRRLEIEILVRVGELLPPSLERIAEAPASLRTLLS